MFMLEGLKEFAGREIHYFYYYFFLLACEKIWAAAYMTEMKLRHWKSTVS